MSSRFLTSSQIRSRLSTPLTPAHSHETRHRQRMQTLATGFTELEALQRLEALAGKHGAVEETPQRMEFGNRGSLRVENRSNRVEGLTQSQSLSLGGSSEKNKRVVKLSASQNERVEIRRVDSSVSDRVELNHILAQRRLDRIGEDEEGDTEADEDYDIIEASEELVDRVEMDDLYNGDEKQDPEINNDDDYLLWEKDAVSVGRIYEANVCLHQKKAHLMPQKSSICESVAIFLKVKLTPIWPQIQYFLLIMLVVFILLVQSRSFLDQEFEVKLPPVTALPAEASSSPHSIMLLLEHVSLLEQKLKTVENNMESNLHRFMNQPNDPLFALFDSRFKQIEESVDRLKLSTELVSQKVDNFLIFDANLFAKKSTFDSLEQHVLELGVQLSLVSSKLNSASFLDESTIAKVLDLQLLNTHILQIEEKVKFLQFRDEQATEVDTKNFVANQDIEKLEHKMSELVSVVDSLAKRIDRVDVELTSKIDFDSREFVKRNEVVQIDTSVKTLSFELKSVVDKMNNYFQLNLKNFVTMVDFRRLNDTFTNVVSSLNEIKEGRVESVFQHEVAKLSLQGYHTDELVSDLVARLDVLFDQVKSISRINTETSSKLNELEIFKASLSSIVFEWDALVSRVDAIVASEANLVAKSIEFDSFVSNTRSKLNEFADNFASVHEHGNAIAELYKEKFLLLDQFMGAKNEFGALVTKVSRLEDRILDVLARMKESSLNEIGSTTSFDHNMMIDAVEDYVTTSLYGKRVDYALKAFGAKVIDHSESHCSASDDFLLNLFVSDRTPDDVIDVNLGPTRCWPMKGASGFVVIQLRVPVIVEEFVISHIARRLTPDFSSAPKQLRVYGITDVTRLTELVFLVDVEYSANGKATQHFPIFSSELFAAVRIEVVSNYGSADYTCLYRFQIYGSEQGQ